MARRYNVDTQDYQEFHNNQRLMLVVVLCAMALFLLVAFIGICWYLWGEWGAKLALYLLGGTFLLSFGWFVVMNSINAIANIYRDAVMTIVDFQSADDRGEVMRHMAKVVTADRGLDKSVLTLAGNLAKGQTKALTDSYQTEQRLLDQQRNDVWQVADNDEYFTGWE